MHIGCTLCVCVCVCVCVCSWPVVTSLVSRDVAAVAGESRMLCCWHHGKITTPSFCPTGELPSHSFHNPSSPSSINTPPSIPASITPEFSSQAPWNDLFNFSQIFSSLCRCHGPIFTFTERPKELNKQIKIYAGNSPLLISWILVCEISLWFHTFQ